MVSCAHYATHDARIKPADAALGRRSSSMHAPMPKRPSEQCRPPSPASLRFRDHGPAHSISPGGSQARIAAIRACRGCSSARERKGAPPGSTSPECPRHPASASPAPPVNSRQSMPGAPNGRSRGLPDQRRSARECMPTPTPARPIAGCGFADPGLCGWHSNHPAPAPRCRTRHNPLRSLAPTTGSRGVARSFP